VLVRVHQRARNETKLKLRKEGYKLTQFTHKDICRLADEYFEEHRVEHVAWATQDIATWPGFLSKVLVLRHRSAA
jgi:hypothetical protein